MNTVLKVFQLDLRSLALGRIFLGVIVVVDLLFSFARRHQYYTELGMFPRASVPLIDSMEHSFSLYFALSWTGFTSFLLILSILIAVCFTLGYQTKWSSRLIWLAVLFLQERNRFVLIGGDSWLRVALFWFMFLPVGEYFSLDRNAEPEKTRYQIVANAASFGLVMQAVYIYLWAGMAKFGDDWWQGKAVYYVLQGDEFGYGLAQYALYFPKLLYWSSVIVPYLEIAAALALIVPWKHKYFRAFGVVSLICLHLGIWCTMELYHFSAICIALLVSLAPSFVWRGKDEKRGPFEFPKGLSVFMIVLTFFTWIYNPYRIYREDKLNRNLHLMAEFVGAQQLWQLFAPVAPKSTFIIYAVAELDDGTLQHLSYRGNKRERAPGPNDPEFEVRLSRYWRSLVESHSQSVAFHAHAAWFARLWQRLYPDQAQNLVAMHLYYQTYNVAPNYEDLPPEAPTLVAEYKLPR